MSASGRTPVSCPVCGAGVHPRDRFCAACGADVVAAGDGSLYDDLMSPDDRDATAGGAAAGGYDDGYGGRTAAYDPPSQDDAGYAADDRSGHGYDDDPAGYAAAGGYAAGSYAGRSGGDHPYTGGGYGGAGYGGDARYPNDTKDPSEERRGRGAVLLPLGVLLVVALVAVVAWQLAPRGERTETAAPAPSSSAPPAQSPSATEPSPEDSPTPEESPSSAEPSPTRSEGPRKVRMASSAARCGEDGGAVAYRGNDVTSCEFSVEVAKELGSSDLPATVTARSPVTKKSYTMRCQDTAPVTCRGGNDALVYVEQD
ncbi:zinc ribbon domain-containing protein [Phycicoccus flavus]|uniref:Zinc-ribbon domain-containing protein n=1 Tax=Phycicoccus flavus TaxID=2502783 RepID=A0A8T6R761_9MICO|nr:zinc ribbon domain-containing protein [Phycicoccus flavus]NHA69817.1 hypothetical protein [Phycicoccus flavus]